MQNNARLGDSNQGFFGWALKFRLSVEARLPSKGATGEVNKIVVAAAQAAQAAAPPLARQQRPRRVISVAID